MTPARDCQYKPADKLKIPELYLEKYKTWKEKRSSDITHQTSTKRAQIKPREATRFVETKPSTKLKNPVIKSTKMMRQTVENKPTGSLKSNNSIKRTEGVKWLGVTAKSNVGRAFGYGTNSLVEKRTTILMKEGALHKPNRRRSSLRLSKQSVQPHKTATCTSKLPMAEHSTLRLSRTVKTQPVCQPVPSTRPWCPLTTTSVFGIRQTKTSLARLFPAQKEEFSRNQQKWQVKKADQKNRAFCGSKQGRPPQKRDEPNKHVKENINRRRTMPVADNKTRKEKRYSVVQKFRKTNLSVRAELEKWLISKGRTPSRCRHMTCFGHAVNSTDLSRSTTKRLLSVKELSSQQKALELERDKDKVGEEMSTKLGPMLKECFDLLNLGCPADLLLSWLDNVEENLPMCGHSAEFWLCRAKVTLSTGNTDKVLEIMETAVQHGAKPSDVLAKGLTGLVKEMTESSYSYEGVNMESAENGTPRIEMNSTVLSQLPVNVEHISSTAKTPAVQKENIFQSSAIKLSVMESTPFMKRRAAHEIVGPCVITPVRRSTRRSLATIPGFLVDKDRLYSNVMEMSVDDQHRSLYRENPAIPEDSLLQLQT